MADSDLQRAKADLHRLSEALGLTTEVDRPIGHALVAASGLASLLWTALAPPQWHFLGMFTIALPVVYVISLRVKHRASAGGSPLMRRQFTQAVAVLSLGIPVMVFCLWARYLHVAPLFVLATVVFFVGLMVVGGATQHRVALIWGLALMAGALLIPLGLLPPVSVIASILILGGSISALIAARRAPAQT